MIPLIDERDDIRKEAAFAFSNATTGGRTTQLRYFLQMGFLEIFCDLLYNRVGFNFPQLEEKNIPNMTDFTTDFSIHISEYIFSFLDSRDVGRSAQVNKMWQNICNNDCIWQRLFERRFKQGGKTDPTISWKEVFRKEKESAVDNLAIISVALEGLINFVDNLEELGDDAISQKIENLAGKRINLLQYHRSDHIGDRAIRLSELLTAMK